MTTSWAEELDAMLHGGGFTLAHPRIRYLQLRAVIVGMRRSGMHEPPEAIIELFRLSDAMEAAQ